MIKNKKGVQFLWKAKIDILWFILYTTLYFEILSPAGRDWFSCLVWICSMPHLQIQSNKSFHTGTVMLTAKEHQPVWMNPKTNQRHPTSPETAPIFSMFLCANSQRQHQNAPWQDKMQHSTPLLYFQRGCIWPAKCFYLYSCYISTIKRTGVPLPACVGSALDGHLMTCTPLFCQGDFLSF